MANRPLDDDELSLLEAVRTGAREASDAGAASVAVRWERIEEAGGGRWPVIVLAPTDRLALPLYCWMSPVDHQRRPDLTVAQFAVGGLENGILAAVGAPDREKLAENASRCVRSFVEGAVECEARAADPDEYDGPIAPGAMTVHLRWSFRTPHGTGGAVTKAYLADPVAFARATGVAVGDQPTRLPGYLAVA
jgi:hypothetical protein